MPEYAARSGLFQLLSLETRLRILDELRHGDACVCHLQHHLNRPQAYVSQQLRILKDASVVEAQKQGANVFYILTDPLVRSLLELSLGPVDETRAPDPACPCPHCSTAECGPEIV